MSHSGHHIEKCSCGAVISQCRCMDPGKTVTVIERGCKTCKAQDNVPQVTPTGVTSSRVPGPPDPPKLPFEIYG